MIGETETPVDVEAARLESVISTVFEDRHYDPDCGCYDCNEARQFLSPADLRFVNNAARIIRSSPKEPNAAVSPPFV